MRADVARSGARLIHFRCALRKFGQRGGEALQLLGDGGTRACAQGFEGETFLRQGLAQVEQAWILHAL